MADAAIETAPTDENDDNWLYGESNTDQTENEAAEGGDKAPRQKETTTVTADGEDKEQDEGEVNNDDSQFNDEHFAEVDRDDQNQANGDADSQDNGDSDSDDSDDVKVTIGEIKSGPQYASLNIKRGVGLVASGVTEKPRTGTTTGGKVTLEDLDGPGSINGVPALEFNIDTIEDKPWNKPGADISDYFNYGFNEVTWSAYCERQRRLRVSEAGVALHAPPPTRAPVQDMRRNAGPMRNDDSMPQVISNNYQSRENTIQVMTAERREYGRGGHPRDAPPPDFFGAPPPEHYYPPPHAPYDEPWGTRHPEASGWAPSEIKELTPGLVTMGPPPGVPPPTHPQAPFAPPYRPPQPPHPSHPHPYDRERERDRERDRDRAREERDRRERERREEEERERERERERSRSMKPERVREKSYRRERSRSRSRRHKSRSRSPRLRERSPRERERSRERDRDGDRPRDRDRERTKPKTKEPKDKDDEK